ncbi:hypothetical protein BITS_1713 [Bifidobacterium tsurumiense]|uniref:Uncharacterized protein n=1 Tax=Bifidobacterium tsurumiense TaxID=356829 RepID=A0A087EKV7_9BIFI|nr:hypothetical protein BITS_1713 [Bifidobacterium tsurumiense]
MNFPPISSTSNKAIWLSELLLFTTSMNFAEEMGRESPSWVFLSICGIGMLACFVWLCLTPVYGGKGQKLREILLCLVPITLVLVYNNAVGRTVFYLYFVCYLMKDVIAGYLESRRHTEQQPPQ